VEKQGVESPHRSPRPSGELTLQFESQCVSLAEWQQLAWLSELQSRWVANWAPSWAITSAWSLFRTKNAPSYTWRTASSSKSFFFKKTYHTPTSSLTRFTSAAYKWIFALSPWRASSIKRSNRAKRSQNWLSCLPLSTRNNLRSTSQQTQRLASFSCQKWSLLGKAMRRCRSGAGEKKFRSPTNWHKSQKHAFQQNVSTFLRGVSSRLRRYSGQDSSYMVRLTNNRGYKRAY